MSRKTFIEFDRQCDHCGKIFTVKSRKPSQRFCGRQCFNKSQRNQINVTCPICFKNFSVIESRLKNNVMGLYCSRKCYGIAKHGTEPANKDRTQRSCGVCGSVFECTKKSRQKYCTTDCFHKAHAKYMKEHPSKTSKRIERICDWCKKTFKIIPSKANRNDGIKAGRFCCRQCMNEWKKSRTGKEHPLDKKITCICQWCGKEYRAKRVYEKTTKFCSRQCQGSYAAHNMGRQETTIEATIRQLLNENGIRYIQEAPVGPYVCDFYVESNDSKVIIECDGTYWHSLPHAKRTDKRKDGWAASHGYKIVRLPEEKINSDLAWCKEEIIQAISPSHQESVSDSQSICIKHVQAESNRPMFHQVQLSFDF